MAVVQIPPHTTLVDGQFVQVSGPDGITSSYHYDQQQRALYFKESQVLFPSLHGASHIAEDPVPAATCDTPGLMSADDKCKLDAFIGTRLGVLGFQGAGFCVLPDGRVMMADGSCKPIKQIEIGDIVIGGSGLPRVVEKIFTRLVDEEVFTVNCRTHVPDGLQLTRGHKVLAVKRAALECVRPDCSNRKGLPCRHNSRHCSGCEFEGIPRAIPQWIPVEKLEVGDFIANRKSPVAVGQCNNLRISDYIQCKIRDNVAWPAGLYQKTTNTATGKIYAEPQLHINATGCSLPQDLSITNDLLRLFGYFLAEGSATRKRFSFALHRDELDQPIGEDICHICNDLFGIEPTIIYDREDKGRDSDGVQLIFNHSLIARLLKSLFGNTAHNKRVPRFLMELPSSQQRHILVGFLRGDGYSANTYKSKNIQTQLCNNELVEQIGALLHRCGCRPSYQKPGYKIDPWDKVSTRYSYIVSGQASEAKWLWSALDKSPVEKQRNFSLHVDQGEHQFDEIREIKTHRHTGAVYDLTIPDEHSYVVNGVIVHNSDDGGWMQGDIILAAGTDFISLERIGNVIRFTVDSPVPLNCDCEECQQIFWVQDETDIASIRPPTCGGKLPGVNAYGEMKIYLFPESTIADPNDVAATIQNKGIYPAMVFKRYDDAIVPGAGEYELILKRDVLNTLQTEIGWAFTPGAAGIPQNVWFMGKDDDGSQVRFDMEPETTPGLLGSVLFNGHLITKRMGVVTAYTSTVLSTNQYTIRKWDVDTNTAIGDSFTAQNVWQYDNPENSTSGSDPQQIILDASIDLLPIGTLVDLWAFKVGEISGEPILRYYFKEKPHLNPSKMWSWIGRQQFGDTAIAREETNTTAADTADDVDDAIQVSAVRAFTTSQWGLTGLDDPLLDFDIVSTEGTENADLNTNHRAVIDTSIPGLLVVDSEDTPTIFSERPVWLWNRHTLCNKIFRIDMGRPDSSDFTPYDVVFRAPIDEFTNIYMKVVEIGTVNNLNYIRIVGANFHDLPSFGAVRIISRNQPNNVGANLVFNYTRKMISPEDPSNSVILSSDSSDNTLYPGQAGDVVELLHQEYTSPVVRLEFSFNPSTELIQVQFKVGILDMGVAYEENDPTYADDYVRGLQAGYAVSAIYSQAGTFSGVGTQPDSSVEGFVVYDGGAQIGGDEDEYWNRLEVMVRDDQVWLWWNQLLIPPSTTASAQLPTPTAIDTPYFPTENDPNTRFGKCGVRMWPGSTVRRLDVRTQLTLFNEFTYGQLEIT